MRQYTGLDKLIHSFDQALRSLVPGTTSAQRENPAQPVETQLTVSDARHVAGLMRVNHSGEVCAQALYHGQAMTAKLPNVRREMEQAAIEEQDHLAWCEDRLKELDSHTSLLNPVWYGLSFGMGAIAGSQAINTVWVLWLKQNVKSACIYNIILVSCHRRMNVLVVSWNR